MRAKLFVLILLTPVIARPTVKTTEHNRAVVGRLEALAKVDAFQAVAVKIIFFRLTRPWERRGDRNTHPSVTPVSETYMITILKPEWTGGYKTAL